MELREASNDKTYSHFDTRKDTMVSHKRELIPRLEFAQGVPETLG